MEEPTPEAGQTEVKECKKDIEKSQETTSKIKKRKTNKKKRILDEVEKEDDVEKENVKTVKKKKKENKKKKRKLKKVDKAKNDIAALMKYGRKGVLDLAAEDEDGSGVGL